MTLKLNKETLRHLANTAAVVGGDSDSDSVVIGKYIRDSDTHLNARCFPPSDDTFYCLQAPPTSQTSPC